MNGGWTPEGCEGETVFRNEFEQLMGFSWDGEWTANAGVYGI
jgi:hypothetical protein